MKKRILPVLLALALVMSMLPMVFAAKPSDCLEGCVYDSDSDTMTSHAANCPNAVCTDSDCKNQTEHTVGSSSHQWACKCTGAEGTCHNTTSHTSGNCTGTASAKGGSCSDCTTDASAPGGSEAPDESEEPTGPVCNGEANCPLPADQHEKTEEKYTCKSMCTMSAACESSVHKTNCVACCTYVQGEADGSDCPNTSGDPTVHKAGCAKANVSDSIVLNPTEPTESVEPSEEPTTPVEITKAEDFSDVEADDWFAADLTTVVEKGWIMGNEDGSFDPEGEVSGQQAVVFISRMLGKDLVTTGANWADEATAWAAEDGLTEGIEITSEGIARKDLILLLWRAAGKQPSDHEITFTDVDDLDGDYLTALKWAVENGIIMGNDDGTAAPTAATSRSEISVMLVRYDNAVNK